MKNKLTFNVTIPAVTPGQLSELIEWCDACNLTMGEVTQVAPAPAPNGKSAPRQKPKQRKTPWNRNTKVKIYLPTNNKEMPPSDSILGKYASHVRQHHNGKTMSYGDLGKLSEKMYPGKANQASELRRRHWLVEVQG